MLELNTQNNLRKQMQTGVFKGYMQRLAHPTEALKTSHLPGHYQINDNIVERAHWQDTQDVHCLLEL